MSAVKEFEELLAQYYNAPYAVAVDCCTHALELCLRLLKPNKVTCPTHTYISIPMTFNKLNIDYQFVNEKWYDYYNIGNTNIVDGGVYWGENSYMSGTLMCLSFQFKKHLNLSRGGMILLDDHEQAAILRKMRYDGRTDDKPWAEQDIDTMGYHYYMTPETAELGIERFHKIKDKEARRWSYKDYPDISKLSVFNAK